MKKSWGLLPKILSGEKTVESRWYKSKIAPWDRIEKRDVVYFKDSGKPVTAKAMVTKVKQYEIRDNEHALKVMSRYCEEDLGVSRIPDEVKDYIFTKKYAIFVWFNGVEKVPPFKIDKTGYGLQCAWVVTETDPSVAKRSTALLILLFLILFFRYI